MKTLHIALISALSLGAALPMTAVAAPDHKTETKATKTTSKKSSGPKTSCHYVVKNHKKVKVCQ